MMRNSIHWGDYETLKRGFVIEHMCIAWLHLAQQLLKASEAFRLVNFSGEVEIDYCFGVI